MRHPQRSLLRREDFLPCHPFQRTPNFSFKSQPGPAHMLPEEKLSNLSLIHQIEVGIEKDHTETEITQAVIRAVSPGLPLGDMLEIKCGLTLSAHHTILKGHYKVDSSTDLYHQLINISQEPKESALNFVCRAIKPRRNVYGQQQMRTLRKSTAEPLFSASSSTQLKLDY